MSWRVRSRGGFTPMSNIAYEWKDSSCAHTTWTLLSTIPGQKIGKWETFSDYVTPKFRSRIAKGEIIMNPMSKRSRECTVQPGSRFELTRISGAYDCAATLQYAKYRSSASLLPMYVHLVNGGTSSDVEPVNPHPILSSSDISSLVGDTVTRCWANRTLADSNLFESVAEYRTTMRMFGDLFLRTNNTLKKYLRRKARGTADIYLMVRYGILPLARDVQSIVKGLEKPRGGRVRKTARARGIISRTQTTSLSYTTSSVHTININRIDSDEVEVRAMSLDEYAQRLAANIGFTDAGFLTTPWELISKSFVLDWFVNVGQYLQALAPMQGRSQLGSCYVVKRTTTSVYTTVSHVGIGQWYVLSPAGGSLTATHHSVDRHPALGPPTLQVKPDFRFDEFTRAADALALVMQSVDRMFTRR